MKIILLLVCILAVIFTITDASGSESHKKSSLREKKSIQKNSSNAAPYANKPKRRSSSTDPNADDSIQDTEDPDKALAIYNANGIVKNSAKKITVYTLIGNGTSITYGHAVCKRLLERLRINSGLKSVEIITDAQIDAEKYKHANKKDVNNNLFKFLFGAKCNHGDGERDFLFVTDTKIKNYYYVFQGWNDNKKLYVEIKACLKINIEATDFPVINKVQETADGLIGEAIFGKFGFLEETDPSHVCCINSPANRSFLVCGSYQRKYKNRYEAENLISKCGKYKITKQPLKGLPGGTSETTVYPFNMVFYAAECEFKLAKTDLREIILLFNTARKPDHYYVAENHVQHPYNYWQINSIIQLQF